VVSLTLNHRLEAFILPGYKSPEGRRSDAHLWIGNGEPIQAVHLTWGTYRVSMTQYHRCNSMLIALNIHARLFAFYSVGIIACSRWLSVKRHHRLRVSSPTAPQRGASKQGLTTFNTIGNICTVKTVACILPGCSCRKGRRSGGVADAQPPATSFYPSRIRPPVKTQQRTFADWQWDERFEQVFSIGFVHSSVYEQANTISMFQSDTTDLFTCFNPLPQP
jgi:hypothetical protein